MKIIQARFENEPVFLINSKTSAGAAYFGEQALRWPFRIYYSQAYQAIAISYILAGLEHRQLKLSFVCNEIIYYLFIRNYFVFTSSLSAIFKKFVLTIKLL